MDLTQIAKSSFKKDVESVQRTCQSMRLNAENPIDVSMGDFVRKKYNIGMDNYYADLGINPSVDTIQNLMIQPDPAYRFLVPEIIRDALRLGLRKAPIWSDIVAAEVTIKQPTAVQPWINMSDAAPKYVGVGEQIQVGAISYGQKTIKINKIGRGIKIPYEVAQYVAINVIALFLQDFGIKLGQAVDSLLISCLINGEQTNGSESAPIVGVTTTGTAVYADLLRVWVRMSRIGRNPTAILGGETSAIATLNLTEFKTKQNLGPTYSNLNLKTPVPQSTDYYIHGAVPATDQIIVDSSAAALKYNAQPLLIESDKIIANQTLETYASLTTGFSILFRDARVVIDNSQLFSSAGFPTYMDVDSLENVVID